MKKTAVLGASPNPARYAHRAVNNLAQAGHPVIPLGIRKGEIAGHDIQTDWPAQIEGLDTLTLYLGPARQVEHYSYILGLKPKRIIFNPGTENEELEKLAQEQGIETERACTLVLLSIDGY